MRKREYGTGTIYQKGQLWYVRFYVNGKRITRKIVDPETGKMPETRTEANKIGSLIINQFDRIPKFPYSTGDITLSEAIDDYLLACKNDLSPGWFYTVERYLRYRIQVFWGPKTSIKAINNSSIHRFRNELKKRGIENATINKILGTLSKFLKHCSDMEWIVTLPRIKKFPVQEKEVGRVLTDEEIEKILSTAKELSSNHYWFVLLGLYAGLRHSEILRLKWDHIDFIENWIHLPEQKNKSKKAAPLLAKCREELSSVPAKERNGYLIQYNGNPFKSFRESWQKIVKVSGIDPSTRAHDLRHTFSTRLFDRLGFNARVLTRHSSRQAFEKYVHAETKTLIPKAEEVFNHEEKK